MNRFTLRIGLATALLSFSWLTTIWVRSGYTFEVQPLKKDLNDLPLQLEDYSGKDVPLDEGVRKILNADATLSRIYERPDGNWVSVHVSAWIRPESVSSVAPHNPKICYTNSGWKILEERRVVADTSVQRLPLDVLLLQRDGERCVVAFWYRMGTSLFDNATDARRVHCQLWGQPTWPPTIKVMLQIPTDETGDIDESLVRIKRFAGYLFEFTSQL